MGPYPDATAVFDIDSIGLTNLVSNLNHGLDPGGNAIGAADAVRDRRRRESRRRSIRRTSCERFEWKVEAGAEYAITQPVFDVDAAREVPRRRSSTCASRSSPGSGRSSRCATPSSSRTRCRASSVPDAVIARMRRASEKSKEHAVAEGIAIAREMLERVQAAVQGVQVSAPFGKVELALEVFRDTSSCSSASRLDRSPRFSSPGRAIG